MRSATTSMASISLETPARAKSPSQVIVPGRVIDAKELWNESQVILPFDNSLIPLNPLPAFLGPLLSLETFPDNLHFSFPCKIPEENTLASLPSTPIHNFRKNVRMFRTSLSKFDAFKSWFLRHKPYKEQSWKNTGIYELMQLTTHLKPVETSMIGASIFFWNKTTANFVFPYGMMGPTPL